MPEISKNAILQLYIYTWEIILSSQSNPHRLKKENSISLIFISTIIKLMTFFVLQFCLFFLRKNSKELDVY